MLARTRPLAERFGDGARVVYRGAPMTKQIACTASDVVTVYEFEKSRSERVRAQVETFRGDRRVNVRVFWAGERDDEWNPSRKGLSLRADQLPALEAAVAALRAQLDAEAAAPLPAAA